jgi:hypothetical protein
MAKARNPNDKWSPEDYEIRGENYTMNSVRLHELGLSLTIGANGQVMVIKHRVSRGASETLYKWSGDQPQLPPRSERTEH